MRRGEARQKNNEENGDRGQGRNQLIEGAKQLGLSIKYQLFWKLIASVFYVARFLCLRVHLESNTLVRNPPRTLAVG